MNRNKEEIDKLAKIIWDYHLLNHRLKKCDLILVLCSIDLSVARYASQLFLKGSAPLILFSGGLAHKNDLLATSWQGPEAQKFKEVAIKAGVPKNKILIEDKSTNTGENVKFSCRVLRKKGIKIKRIILVQKPYMQRRAYATFLKQWPGEKVNIIVTSPPVSYKEYMDLNSRDDIINIMIGDLERIKVYADKGYQIKQNIPDKVWQAFERLVEYGYVKHLIKKV